METLIIGERYILLDEGREFLRGVLTEIYEGSENYKPCVGVIIDNGNGFLIDKYREIKKEI